MPFLPQAGMLGPSSGGPGIAPPPPTPPQTGAGGGAPPSPAALALGLSAPVLAQQAAQQQTEQAALQAQQHAQTIQTFTQLLATAMQSLPNPEAQAAVTEPGPPAAPAPGPSAGGYA